MKKLFLFIALVFFVFSTNAQDNSDNNSDNGFRVGLNLGIPMGDASDYSSFAGNIDVDYDWSVSNGIDIGLTSGLTYYFGKDNFDDFKYMPIAGSVDFEITEDLEAGGDIGYAISLESGGTGDFLYRFQLRYAASDDVDISARFNSVSGDGSTLSFLSLGVGYSF
ncbi:MAG TPA: hypothetical protein VKN14_09650 [Flavobacteriaceae bacterium]|nr:hypothetical protein [Flavobacteriaceae bacterium]